MDCKDSRWLRTLIGCVGVLLLGFCGCDGLRPEPVYVRTTNHDEVSSQSTTAASSVGDVYTISLALRPAAGAAEAFLYLNLDDPQHPWVGEGASVDHRRSFDLRFTPRFPIVATCSGTTRTEEQIDVAVTPCQGGVLRTEHTAFSALLGDAQLTRAALTASSQFIEDSDADLEWEGTAINFGSQNPSLNTIGSGMLAHYRMRDHSVTMSRRIFIVRSAAGSRFYAVQFTGYSRQEGRVVLLVREL